MCLSSRSLGLPWQSVAYQTPESDILLTYRGTSYQVRQRLSMPSLPIIKLKYRGINYFQSPSIFK
ncbi:MAG: DUF4278 domain-containing protein [Oscillatoria sp. PMC 1051.18]|nr:DUF4278 domain-containing protein [Oscillatoria sp. PMC 1050.18]MEC5028886.1 DUF4278 domain-containing protein [Oscillatoria sp. PMC 1051.18]